jgi:hypothetical protein
LNTPKRPLGESRDISKPTSGRALAFMVLTPLVLDSVTLFPPEARGRAAIAASHGGDYAAYLAAKAGVKAVILCDAGVGRERAGIGGLGYLDRLGVAAAAIGHRSARIGDGADCHARGLISFVNARAAQTGVTPGMRASDALERLEAADAPPAPAPPVMHETRHEISNAHGVRVFTLDSNALVTPEDAGHIMLTGSHGGLLGGRAATAVKYDVFAAIYNDAGFGADDAGISRLPALEGRGIAGACVSAWSARIGDGQSTWRDGFVSAMNARAAACGGEIGLSATEFVARLVAARVKELGK